MLTLIANFKGGTGKSTVVFNLAVWCLMNGREVQVYDLDPQRTVTDTADIRAEMGYEPGFGVAHELPARAPRGEGLIDVGLSDTGAMRAAVRAAGRIVIPVSPSQADIWATQHFLEIIGEERKGKRKPEVLAFVNRADPHPRSRENAETYAAFKLLPGVTALKPRLVQRLAFRRSFSEGLAAFELEPGGKAAKELDALARAIFT
ncbi:AAA family ATPase [Sinisalibacter aestuarii]|uniref:Chromosome partitioning protein ParA n=1 Tax=Sinisalibacter aestuarii TaxID=2949426 RepID=A0ABQ5LS95_9RHOB|nr:AAA family ATPase [Sinisalibacter aestuarii]GKY87498.1 chromosome partitioning protein ParA [Sinisalibacter aestuarii]